MIKAVLFDYGGVLSPGGTSLRPVFSKLLGISEKEVEFTDLHEQFRRGDISAEDFFIKLGEKYGKKVTAADFLQYSDIFVKNQALYDLAKQLREAGVITGVLSNVYQLSAEILKKDGYYEGFKPLILSCEERCAKPDPEIYKIAIQRTGCLPSEIVFVDDQDKCMPPAIRAGLKVIKAESEQQTIRDLKKLFKEENGLTL